jgi:hypothetical protein
MPHIKAPQLKLIAVHFVCQMPVILRMVKMNENSPHSKKRNRKEEDNANWKKTSHLNEPKKSNHHQGEDLE